MEDLTTEITEFTSSLCALWALWWMSSRRFLVVPRDRDGEPDGAARGAEEKQHRKPRVAENAEARLDAHQQRGAEDCRGDQQAERDAVGDFLQPVEQRPLVDHLDAEFQLLVREGVEDAVDAARQPLRERLRLEQRRARRCRIQAAAHPL